MKHKNKILTLSIILVMLIISFWYGGNVPKNEDGTKNTVRTEEKIGDIKTQNQNSPSLKPEEKEIDFIQSETKDEKQSKEENIIVESTYKTEPVPEGKPVPIEPENVVISNKELTCTLSVRCDTILNNISWLDDNKIDILPKDGVIFAEKKIVFFEGESVFNVLMREMKKNKIHLEFVNTPIYNSAYIEGIANLYEFDLGELSGWMYKVNGWFPNYGCSRYQLKSGDRIEWVYTCDLGKDVGSENGGFQKDE